MRICQAGITVSAPECQCSMNHTGPHPLRQTTVSVPLHKRAGCQALQQPDANLAYAPKRCRLTVWAGFCGACCRDDAVRGLTPGGPAGGLGGGAGWLNITPAQQQVLSGSESSE